MVQEFHVVRCFSCQTFQVQQVKKCKKWSCKMCGEKQSLVKEYGRGNGADCRRHVQKLNSLRGGLLEVENEKACILWEDEACKDDEGTGEDVVQKAETRGVSRWTKFVDQTNNCPQDEDEEEDDEVSTERRWCRKNNNVRRRKAALDASHRANSAPRHDEGLKTPWRTKRVPFRQNRDDSFKSPPQIQQSLKESPLNTRRDTSERPEPSTVTLHSDHHSTNSWCKTPNKLTIDQPRVLSNGSFTPPSFNKRPSEAKPVPQDSKWTRFLCSVITDHAEEDDHSSLCGQQTIAGNSQTSEEDTRSLKHETRLDKNVVFCSGGNPSQHHLSPTFTVRPAGTQKPVCVQPPPVKKPCPDLHFNTMFHTDEDFNDVY